MHTSHIRTVYVRRRAIKTEEMETCCPKVTTAAYLLHDETSSDQLQTIIRSKYTGGEDDCSSSNRTSRLSFTRCGDPSDRDCRYRSQLDVTAAVSTSTLYTRADLDIVLYIGRLTSSISLQW